MDLRRDSRRTGGGEVARYLGRHGTKRVATAVLISAIPPLMLKTAANPGGLPMEVFDQLRASVQADRSQFFRDLSIPFHGANRTGATVSQNQGAARLPSTLKDQLNTDLFAFFRQHEKRKAAPV